MSILARGDFSHRFFRSFFLLICLWLAGCCDARLAIDDSQGPRAYTPVVVGNPRFVLEVYAHSNFDLFNSDTGQKFISMDQRHQRPIGQNFARSAILKAAPGTVLEITTENGKKGLGKVGSQRQLKITDICLDNDGASAAAIGTYKTDGSLACRVTRMVVRQQARR